MSDLDIRMPNGASVRDWLGTAGVAATVAAAEIESARLGAPRRQGSWLAKAEEYLEQALDEVRQVQTTLAGAKLDRQEGGS